MYVCADFMGTWVEMKSLTLSFEHYTYLMCNHSVLKHQFCSTLPVTWLGLGRRPPLLPPESNLVAGKLRSPCPHLNYASKPSTSLVMLQSQMCIQIFNCVTQLEWLYKFYFSSNFNSHAPKNLDSLHKPLQLRYVHITRCILSGTPDFLWLVV